MNWLDVYAYVVGTLVVILTAHLFGGYASYHASEDNWGRALVLGACSLLLWAWVITFAIMIVWTHRGMLIK